jgi:hypothetical protein
MIPAAVQTDAYVQSDPFVQYTAATNPNWGANVWAQGQIRNGTGGFSVQQIAQQAYAADAQWKQQQAAAMPQQTGQPPVTGPQQTGAPQQPGQPVTGGDIYEKLKQGKVAITAADLENINFDTIMAMDPKVAKTIIDNMELNGKTQDGKPLLNQAQKDLLAVRLAKSITNGYVDGIGLEDKRTDWNNANLGDDNVSEDDVKVMREAVKGNAEFDRIFGVMSDDYEDIDDVTGDAADNNDVPFSNDITKSGTWAEIEKKIIAGNGNVTLGTIIDENK